MTYDELIIDSGLEEIHELDIKNKGLYSDGIIAISRHLKTGTEKACILAEELGHYHTSVGDITNQTHVCNIKQEKRARCWGYEKLVPIRSLIDAYKYGCKNKHEVSQFLDITEEFLIEAIKFYLEKHDFCYTFGKYVLYFDPLAVFEKYE